MKTYSEELYKSLGKVESKQKQVKETFTNMNASDAIVAMLSQSDASARTLTSSLKEVQKTLTAIGDMNAKSNLKDFMQQVSSEESVSKLEEQKNKVREALMSAFGDEKGAEFVEKFNAVFEQVEVTAEKTVPKVAGMLTEASQEIDEATDKVSEDADKLRSKSEVFTSALQSIGSKLKSVLNLRSIIGQVKTLFNTIMPVINAGNELIETENLFSVSFGNGIENLQQYYDKALSFQNSLSDKLGTNKNESMNFQALFNSIGTSMGLDRNTAYMISENFTKLGYDLSSLYNTSANSAMEKLQAGLSGSSTRPLRSFGIDITQNTLSNTLADLNLGKKMTDLNQAEKMVLRYIAVLRQSSIAHGDFARTLESPANQIKVFQAQLLSFKQNVGGLFQGVLQRWMPYINAMLMVINALIKALSGFLGISVDTQVAGVTSGVDDLESSLGGASDNAKKLKDSLQSFDEIHNIEFDDSKSGSGSGGGGGMSVDQGLLDAMSGYNNLMDGIKNKAEKIRDAIMDWLGFIETANGWIKKDTLTNFDKILDIVKTIGLALLTWKVSSGIANMLASIGVGSAIGNLQIATAVTIGITGFYLAYKGIQHQLNGDISVFSLMEQFIGTTAGVTGLMYALNKMVGGSVTLGSMLKLSIPLAIELTVATFMFSAVKKNFDEVKTWLYGEVDTASLDIGQKLNVAFTSIGKETVGGIHSVAVELGHALGIVSDNTYEVTKNNKKLKESINTVKKAYEDEITKIKENAQQQLLEVEYSRKISQELGELVGTKTELNNADKKRAEFLVGELNSALGTEYTLNEFLNGQYTIMKDKIEEVIASKKKEIALQAYAEIYKQHLMEQIQLEDELEKAQSTLNQAVDQYVYELENHGRVSEVTKDAMENANKAVTDLETSVSSAKDMVQKYGEKWTEVALSQGTDTDACKTKIDEMSNDANEKIGSVIDKTADLEDETNALKENIDKNSKEIRDQYDKNGSSMGTLENKTVGSIATIKTNFDGLETADQPMKKALMGMRDEIDPDKNGAGGQAVNKSKTLSDRIKDLFNWTFSISLPNLNGTKAYATGGFPTQGQMFIAREAGPELVGRIGSHTAVANNDQIIEGIKSGVYEAVATAMSQYGGANVSVYADVDSGIMFRTMQKEEKNYRIQTGKPRFFNNVEGGYK